MKNGYEGILISGIMLLVAFTLMAIVKLLI